MQAEQKDIYSVLVNVNRFIGITFLTPINESSSACISAQFWSEFPVLQSEDYAKALDHLASYSKRADAKHKEEALQDCALEYTKLFIGPPTPAAPPWESMYKGGEAAFPFGQSTAEMKNRLHEIGLEVNKKNNQHEDHMGIEFLYLADVLERQLVNGARVFAEEHPSFWIDDLQQRIEAIYPKGYYAGIAKLGRASLDTFINMSENS